MFKKIYLNSKQLNKFLPLLYLILSFFLFNLSFSKDQPSLNNLDLIFVYEHVRHGARGPSSSYNSLFKNGIDEFRVSWEGEGDGELTLLGTREHYDLGIRNRLKYGKTEDGLGLIDFNHFDSSEVLFHTTDYNRTQMSLNAELIGMYQPGVLNTLEERMINESFPPNKKIWQNKSDENDKLYQKILKEINELGNKTIIDNIPVFNSHAFPTNRIFNLESTCKNIEKIRMENLKDKNDLLFGYFLKNAEILKKFFKFENDSFFSDIYMMNSIVDHYISDYKSGKNLSEFYNETGIDLDEFYSKATKFYYDWHYNFYCFNETCSMEASRLMEDLLGYMRRRIELGKDVKSYKAPKMVIDCGHDTTVGPMQMFMYEAWKDKPEYGINTQYCGFACNLYFELYKSKTEENTYYVFYYMDDELKYVFDYDEFENGISKNIYTQSQIEEYCLSKGGGVKEEKVGIIIKKENNNTALLVGFCTTCFTTLLGIIGIIILIMKIKKMNNLIGAQPGPKIQESKSNIEPHEDN